LPKSGVGEGVLELASLFPKKKGKVLPMKKTEIGT